MTLKAQVRQFDDKDAEDRKISGIVDGGHTYIHCSNCGKGLLDVWHTKPDAIDPATGKPFEWKLQALCCYCGDKSYVIEIKGRYHLGGFGKIVEEDPTQDIPETFPTDVNTVGDKIIIGTVKAKQ